MSQRERRLLIALLGILVSGVGVYAVHNWFVRPLQAYNANLATLREEVDSKDLKIQNILNERGKLDQWRVLGLHSNPIKAAQEYGKYLQELFKKSGLTVAELHGPPANVKELAAGKKAGHTTLGFTVRAQAQKKELVRFLQLFQQAALPHRLRSFTLDSPEGSAAKSTAGKIGIHMTIEVLLIHGRTPQADQLPAAEVLDTLSAIARRPTVWTLVPWAVNLPGPRGQRMLGQASSQRNYADLAKRNPFVGALPPPPPPPPTPKEVPEPVEEGPDMRDFIRLVSITHSDRQTQKYRNHEAFLRNYLVKTNDIRLCSAPRSGYDTFRVYNEEGSRVMLRGKVLRIDARDVYIQVGEDIYGIHIGQTLADAMRRSLSNRELQELGLVEEAAEEEEEGKTKSVSKKGKTKL